MRCGCLSLAWCQAVGAAAVDAAAVAIVGQVSQAGRQELMMGLTMSNLLIFLKKLLIEVGWLWKSGRASGR